LASRVASDVVARGVAPPGVAADGAVAGVADGAVAGVADGAVAGVADGAVAGVADGAVAGVAGGAVLGVVAAGAMPGRAPAARDRARTSRWVPRGPACIVLLACAACADPIASVSVGLTTVPDGVSSISVFVRDLDRGDIVASSTVGPNHGQVLLGVPAERPVEFVVVARTDRPAPAELGTMPAYVGRTVRTIPLGRERRTVGIVAHRAGLLTLSSRAEESAGRRRVVVESEHVGTRPIEVEVPTGNPTWRRTLVVRTGRHTAKLLESEQWRVASGEGLHVAADTESIAPLVFERVPEEPPAEAPSALTIQLTDQAGQPFDPPALVPTVVGGTPIELRLGAVDGDAESIPRLQAALTWSVTSTPGGLVRDGAGGVSGALSSLPATVAFLSAHDVGRAVVRVEAELDDGRLLTLLHRFSVSPGAEPPGPPGSLVLELEPERDLLTGTALVVQLIDRRNRFAAGFDAELDLERSDPWVFVPDGPVFEHGAEDPGWVVRRVSRGSAPLGGELSIRATVTSTALQATLTSTLALPSLELGR